MLVVGVGGGVGLFVFFDVGGEGCLVMVFV